MMTSPLNTTLGLMLIATTPGACSGGDSSGPATCKDAKSTYGVSVDGPQTLYVGGDKTMPWSAFCADMLTDTPKEFVELAQLNGLGAPANFSSFTEGDPDSDLKAAFQVVTQYGKVRIDPVDLTIDITDSKFAYPQVTPPGTRPISAALNDFAIVYMPYATAMQCGGKGTITSDASVAAIPVGAVAGNLDLSGLPFELDEPQLCPTLAGNTSTPDLAQPTKIVNFHALGSTSDRGLICGRASVRCLPDPTANGQVGGQTALHLRYVDAMAKSGH